MLIKQLGIILPLVSIIILGFGCSRRPDPNTTDIPKNIYGRVVCNDTEQGTALQNVTVSIGGKETATASDGSFVLNGVYTEATTLVTISGSSLTQPYSTNRAVFNEIKINIPEQFCSQSASDTISRTKYSKKYQVIFTKPQNGAILYASGSNITQSPCRGKVQGLDASLEDLSVKVYIETNQVYSQGTARVRSDGSWQVTCNFGGDEHRVKAELLRGEETLAEKEIIVQRVSR